jgi:hypothetical protein
MGSDSIHMSISGVIDRGQCIDGTKWYDGTPAAPGFGHDVVEKKEYVIWK